MASEESNDAMRTAGALVAAVLQGGSVEDQDVCAIVNALSWRQATAAALVLSAWYASSLQAVCQLDRDRDLDPLDVIRGLLLDLA